MCPSKLEILNNHNNFCKRNNEKRKKWAYSRTTVTRRLPNSGSFWVLGSTQARSEHRTINLDNIHNTPIFFTQKELLSR